MTVVRNTVDDVRFTYFMMVPFVRAEEPVQQKHSELGSVHIQSLDS